MKSGVSFLLWRESVTYRHMLICWLIERVLLLLLLLLLIYLLTAVELSLGDSSPYSKYKAAPLQGWSGPEGSRKLRFPDFMTTAQDGRKFVSLTHRPPLPTGNTLGTYFC